MIFGLPKLSVDPVGIWPFWLGTLRDVSENGNHGAAVTPLYWTAAAGRDGLQSQTTGRVEVAADSSLAGLTRFTLFFAVDFRVHVTSCFLLRDIANSLHVYLAAPGRVYMYNGGDISWVDADMIGHKTLAITFEIGEKCEVFVDGVSVGLSSVALNITTALSTWRIWGSAGATGGLKNVGHAAAAFPEILPAPEIAELHAYAVSRITPRKQWPGSGLRYPNRHTEQLTNGDFTSWIPGTYPDPADWGTVSPDTPENHITEDPAGHLRMVSNSLEFVGISQSALTVGQLYKCTLVVSAVASGIGIVSGAGPNYFVFSTAAKHVFFFVADSSALILKRGTACDITVDSISVIEQPADYVPHTGDLMYLDNFQTARVSVGDETSGQLSNTGWLIVSGTWRNVEDATTGARSISCISDGTLRRNLPGSDGMVTRTFTATGSAALVKGVVELQITATAADTISAVELEAA